MKPRSAIKTDLFADEHHRKKIDSLGDPLADIELHIDFAALAAEVDRVAPRTVSAQGGRPPYPTETMVRILVLKRLYNLSDEQMEYQLLDRMSYKRFCGLANAANIPDRTTVWTFENRIGELGAKALFEGVSAQLLKRGFIARGGQIIDATLVPAPKQHNSRGEKALIDQGAMPADWKPAKRRQKDTDATWTKKHGKSHFGYKLSINVDKKYKFIRARDRHGQHARQPALRQRLRHEQHEPRRLCRSRLSVRGAGGLVEGERLSESNPAQGTTQQAAVRMPAAAEHAHRADASAGGTPVRGHRANGRQVDPNHRPGAGELRDDDDGSLLQPEAADVFPEGRNRGLLTPEMGRIAAARGDSEQKRGRAAG